MEDRLMLDMRVSGRKEKWQRWSRLHSTFLWRKSHTESRSLTHRRPTRCQPFHYHIIMVFIIIMTLIIIINILIIIRIINIICTTIRIILMTSSRTGSGGEGAIDRNSPAERKGEAGRRPAPGCTTEEAKRTAMQVRMTMDPKSSTVLSVCSFLPASSSSCSHKI